MEKTRLLYLVSLVCFLLSTSVISAKKAGSKQMIIELIPLGKIPLSVLEHLQGHLGGLLEAEVLVGEAKGLPPEAYVPKRQQYLSFPVLTLLAATRVRGQKDHLLLGIMDEDAFTPRLNFIFGQADPENSVAIISLRRLRPSFYGLPENESVFLERALKEAVHEIGHLLGLGHCPDPRCVMHFSNSLGDTDRKDFRFCPKCRGRLR